MDNAPPAEICISLAWRLGVHISLSLATARSTEPVTRWHSPMLAPSSFWTVSRRKPSPFSRTSGLRATAADIRLHFRGHHAMHGKWERRATWMRAETDDMSGIWRVFTFWARR